MSNNEHEDTFEKIRKLLRKSESSTFEEEAELFLRKAQELMLRFRIDEEFLWANDPEKRPEITTISIGIKDKQPGAQYKRIILRVIAELSSCRMYYLQGGDQSKVVGYPKDLAFVDLLYTSIMSQSSFAMAKAQAISMARPGYNVRTFRNNFYRGFADRISQRLRTTYQKAIEDVAYTGGTALVLADRSKQVAQWVQENLNLRTVYSSYSGRRDDEAATHGKFAADVTNINVTPTVPKAPTKGELNK